jgi:TolB protein
MSHVVRAAAAAVIAAGVVASAAGPSAAAPVNGRIVFVGQDAGAGTWGGVFSMASDGSDVVRLTADTEVATDPEYSPDGRRIAYSANHDAYANVYTMAADGSGVRRLTETPFSDGGDLFPTWTPDGLGLVFVSTRGQDAADYGGFDLYRVDADGTDEQRLTVTARDVDDTQPAVSPDGTRIAFVSDRPVPDYGFTDLFVMDIDGSDVQRLTFDAEPDGASFGHYADSPVWSPDGSRIAFSSDRSGNKDIWVVDADGTDLTNLTADPSEDLDPAWSPDGSTLTWTSSPARSSTTSGRCRSRAPPRFRSDVRR